MKKAIILALAAFSAAVSQAQPNFNGYALGEHTISFTANNRSVTYKYINDDVWIKLYNTANRYTGVNIAFADTGDLKGGDPGVVTRKSYALPAGRSDDQIIIGILNRVITEVDGPTVRRNINPHGPLRVDIAIDVSTGRVAEVEFLFETEEGFDAVSPRAYHFIAEAIKQELTYFITGLGRQLNFLRLYASVYLPEVN